MNWWAIRQECKKCEGLFDNHGDVRRKYCDECKKHGHAKRNMDTAERLAEHDVMFVGFDGEGQTGPCMDKACSCTLYVPENPDVDNSPCRCGHRKLPFRVPGESFTYRNGHSHKYVEVRCGDYTFENLDGIKMEEWLHWMYFEVAPNYPRDAAYVVYSGGYDLTMLWSTMPENRVARMLLSELREARKNLPVDYPYENPTWQMDAINSTFRFRPYDPAKRHRANPKDEGWIHLCDVFPFWQSSFLRAIDPSKYPPDMAPCTPEVYEKIKQGKERRDIAVLDDEMREYNRLEVETLANLVSGFNRQLVRIGVRLKRHEWYGPGAVAAKTLSNWKIPRFEEIEKIVPATALEAWHASYTAGWFEIFVHGTVNGTVYEYDINSAYPHVISELPCLRHGKWSFGHNYQTKDYSTLPELPPRAVRLIYASVHGSNKYAGAMLHRMAFGNHQIMRPHNTEGWYKQEELEWAQRAELIDNIEYKEWWTYEPCSCAPPMSDIKGMYERRRSLPPIHLPNGKILEGKDTPEGKALKLGPNSVYGKFAQQIGKHPYLNWIYASMITSGCRTMILQAIATHPDKMKAVAKIATDGVYFMSPHPKMDRELSDNLGGWSREEHDSPTFFGSGIDWDIGVARMGEGIIKSRGVNGKEAVKQSAEVTRRFREFDPCDPSQAWPVMKIRKPFELYSPVQLIRWGQYPDGEVMGRSKWRLAGIIFESTETISSNPLPKRRTCSTCLSPYHHREGQCDRDGMYQEDGLWRSGVFYAGQLANGAPGPSHSYTHIKSMREELNRNPSTTGLDTEGDTWSAIREELESVL